MRKLILIIFCFLFLREAFPLNFNSSIEKDFKARSGLLKRRQHALLDVFKGGLTDEENTYLKFLYAYMPLNDMADLDGSFFLGNVRTAICARNEFPWGSKVPEDIFLHFVLPYRVNNENCDTSRFVMFSELKERLKNMDIGQAALEVNHWCHGKATYKSTDSRTIAPLGIMKSGFGRCGEESTFLVSALRSVGIPARQCYTPRWAHQDDNHAWVEVWAGGKWYYMGACEPEAVLNLGWFTEPARRAMLVHTKAFGAYRGQETLVSRQKCFAQINVLGNYAEPKTIHVKVEDEKGRPAAGAAVKFKIYNYAEFYTIASVTADKRGRCSFVTGIGDILAFAHKGEKSGLIKISAVENGQSVIRISSSGIADHSEDIKLVPPVEKLPLPENKAGREENSIRLKEEDRLRDKYAASFPDSAASEELARRLEYDPVQVRKYISLSRGNYPEIIKYLEASVLINKQYALKLLSTLSVKDFRDTDAAVLLDHLKNTFNYSAPDAASDKDMEVRYLLAPRFRNEKLSGYKKYLQDKFGSKFIGESRKDISVLINWIRKEIETDDEDNYYNVPVTPIGVYELRRCDRFSRDLFFAAACRSIGIPARMETGTDMPQYFSGGRWCAARFTGGLQTNKAKGSVQINLKDKKVKPSYYMNYTIARFESGDYKTMDFEEYEDEIKLDDKMPLDAGKYLLVTGSRNSDGTVFSRLKYFTVKEGQNTEVDLEIPEITEEIADHGMIDMALKFEKADGSETVSLTSVLSSKGTVLAWLDPEKEPAKHFLSDLNEMKPAFEELGAEIILVASKEKIHLIRDNFPALPKSIKICLPAAGSKSIAEMDNLPLIRLLDKNGKILFMSGGYKIGLGGKLARLIRQYQNSCSIK